MQAARGPQSPSEQNEEQRPLKCWAISRRVGAPNLGLLQLEKAAGGDQLGNTSEQCGEEWWKEEVLRVLGTEGNLEVMKEGKGEESDLLIIKHLTMGQELHIHCSPRG